MAHVLTPELRGVIDALSAAAHLPGPYPIPDVFSDQDLKTVSGWNHLVLGYLDNGGQFDIDPAAVLRYADAIYWHLTNSDVEWIDQGWWRGRDSTLVEHLHTLGACATACPATLSAADTIGTISSTALSIMTGPWSDQPTLQLTTAEERWARLAHSWIFGAALGDPDQDPATVLKLAPWACGELLGLNSTTPDWEIVIGVALLNTEAPETEELGTVDGLRTLWNTLLDPYRRAVATGACDDPEVGAILVDRHTTTADANGVWRDQAFNLFVSV